MVLAKWVMDWLMPTKFKIWGTDHKAPKSMIISNNSNFSSRINKTSNLLLLIIKWLQTNKTIGSAVAQQMSIHKAIPSCKMVINNNLWWCLKFTIKWVLPNRTLISCNHLLPSLLLVRKNVQLLLVVETSYLLIQKRTVSLLIILILRVLWKGLLVIQIHLNLDLRQLIRTQKSCTKMWWSQSLRQTRWSMKILN